MQSLEEAEVIDVTPKTELKPVEPDSNELGDGDEDDGEDYAYNVLWKNGHVTNHNDERDPAQIALDFKVSLLYPLTAKSAFSDEEWSAYQEAAKADPKRFQRRDAKLYLFQIGFGSDDEEIACLDPREIQAVILAHSFGPEDLREDEEEDVLPQQQDRGRKSLRSELNRRMGD